MMILLGGPCVLRTTGPSVRTVIVPLLQGLDGQASRDEILARMPTADRDRARAFLDDLQACGLLEDGPVGSPLLTGVAAEFVRRFSSLSEEPMQAFGRTPTRGLELVVDGPSPWREDVIALLAGGLRGPVGSSMKPGRVAASIDLGRTRAKLIAPAGDGGRWILGIDHPTADADGPSGRASVGGLNLEQQPAMVAALIEHWLIAVAAGFPTIPSVKDAPLWRATLRRLKAGSRLPPLDPGHDVGTVEPPNWVSEIFRFAVGRQATGGLARRISPSAGDLQSCSAVWLAREPADPMTVSACAYDARYGQFHRLRDIPEAQAAEALGGPAPDHAIVFVSSLTKLRLRYGARASVLAQYDVGVSAHHVGEAARSAGGDAESLSVPDSDGLLAALGLAAGNDRRVGAVFLLRAPPGSASTPSTAGRPALQTMLRRRSVRRFSPSPMGLEQAHAIERGVIARFLSPSIVLYRGLRDELGRVQITEVLAAVESRTPAVALLNPGAFNLTVPQLGLSQAQLFYFIGQKRPVAPYAKDPRQQWTTAGELYSALWLEAVSHGLVGSLCGGVEIGGWISRPSAQWEDVALCLGHP